MNAAAFFVPRVTYASLLRPRQQMMRPARLDLLVLRDLTQQKAWEGSDLRQLVHWLLSIKLTVGP